MRELRGRVCSADGVYHGVVEFDTTIRSVYPKNGRADDVIILPGFIDTHVHGGGGGDAMDGADGVRRLARFHARHGTTTLLPTTRTNPLPELMRALRSIHEVAAARDRELPDIPGAHLEGPFISPHRLGAQPNHPAVPTEASVEALLQLGVILLATIAPEIDNATMAARRMAQAGIRVNVGHTNATYEEVSALVSEVEEVGGTVGFTHLFNAMGGMEGRSPGVVGAALAHASTYAELIFDGHHVYQGSFLAAVAAKRGKLHLITDAMRACGVSADEVESNGRLIKLCNGSARLPDGTLAGSLLTLDKALVNATDAGIRLEEASAMLSKIPAAFLGLADRGEIRAGLRADMVVLDARMRVKEVFVAGQAIQPM